jgi:predicted transcriptional regulator
MADMTKSFQHERLTRSVIELLALSITPLTLSEIQLKVCYRRQRIIVCLQKLIERGLIQKIGKGVKGKGYQFSLTGLNARSNSTDDLIEVSI